MDPMEWRLPGVMRCAGCGASPETWPLHYARHRGVFGRMCASCLLLTYRSMYCCGCFLLLGATPPTQNNDPLVAPHEATVTCLACHEAVAHLSCIDYSTVGVFICPACSAAAARRPFSYAPFSGAPLDIRGARVVVLSTRIALTLLEKEAARAQAMGERMAAESAKERKEAYRTLSLALGINTKAQSTNILLPPTKNKGKEPQIDMGKLDLNEPYIDMAELDLNEPAPPPSPARLELCSEGIGGGMSIAYNKPRPSSMVRFTFGVDCLRREQAVASSEPPPTFMSGMQGVGRESTMASTKLPLPSLAMLTLGTEGAHGELAIPSTEPPLPSMAALTPGMEGVCREFATASKVPPRKPRTLQLYSKDNEEEDKE